MNILIVEDDEDIRESLTELLDLEGYRVSSAGNGKEGLDRLRAAGPALPQLILLDLNMPVMTGQELLTALASESEGLRRIPVFVMTAVPDPELSGVAALLKKPLDIENLLDRLQNLREA